MKITDKNFFKARNDKYLRCMILRRRKGKDTLELNIEKKDSYGETHNTYVEIDTEINVENYRDFDIREICFLEYVYPNSRIKHILTFLKAIRKDSDVSFHLRAFNNHQHADSMGYEMHQLYGIVNNKVYQLSTYAAPQNLASPVR